MSESVVDLAQSAVSVRPVLRAEIAFPSTSGPRFKRPDWTQVSDEELAAEIVRRSIEEPLLLWQPGKAPRREIVASTMRGVVVASGGTRSAKTVGAGAVKGAAIAEGLLSAICCPEWCPQYGWGTCGLHCCPITERGAATVPGCVGGTKMRHALPCPMHPALEFPAGTQSTPNARTILVGGLSLEKWENAILPAFERWLSRYPDGSPQWRVRDQDHAIEHEKGRYRVQFYPYDDPKRWESTDPVFIMWDEIGPHSHFRASMWRTLSQNTQLLICGTPVDLKDNPERAAWLFPEILHKVGSPLEAVQVFYLRSLDNVFLEPAARERLRSMLESLHASGNEQEAEIRGEGRFYMRQDACFYSRDTIERQAKHVRDPIRHFVSFPEVMSQAPPMERDPYFMGETRYPAPCSLTEASRKFLEERRNGTERGGIACYDCIDRCPAYTAPPRLHRVQVEVVPTIGRVKPPRGEYHDLSIWTPPQEGHRYAAGGDNAKGTPEGDYSVLDIFDVDTGEQVAQYHGRPRVDAFEWIIYVLWRWYGFFLVFEENGFGLEILISLRDRLGMEPADIFSRFDKTMRDAGGNPTPQLGFYTTRGNKGTAATLETPYGDYGGSPLALYARYLRTQELILRSHRSWRELGTFMRVNGRLAGLPGTNDDTNISGSLGALAVAIKRAQTMRRVGEPVFHDAYPIGAPPPMFDAPPGVSYSPTVDARPKTLTGAEWEAKFARPRRRY